MIERDPLGIYKKRIVGGAEIVRSTVDRSIFVRDIPDDTGSVVVMDLIISRSREAWLVLRDQEKPPGQELSVLFRPIVDASTFPEAQPVLSDLAYNVWNRGEVPFGYAERRGLHIPDDGEWNLGGDASVTIDKGRVSIKNIPNDEGNDVLMDLEEVDSGGVIVVLKRNPLTWSRYQEEMTALEIRFNGPKGGPHIQSMSYFMRMFAFAVVRSTGYKSFSDIRQIEGV